MIGLFWLAATQLAAGIAPGIQSRSTPNGMNAEVFINGVPTRVIERSVRAPLEETARVYRSGLGPRRIELPMAQGTLIAAPMDGYFITVQLTRLDDKRTQSRMSIANLKGTVQSALPLLLPTGSKLLSRVGAQDAGKHSDTLVARNRQSVISNLAYLQQHLRADGYSLSDKREVYRDDHRGTVLWFEAPGRSVQIVAFDIAGETLLNIVVVKAVS
jgi:hypothetical protein